MAKRERVAAVEDVSGHQDVGHISGRVEREIREARGVTQARPVSEHGDRAGERGAAAGQPSEPDEHVVNHRPLRQLLDARARIGRYGDAAASSAASSSLSRKGFPPVTRWQAAATSAAAPGS
jgi:hypothetical protein